MTKRMIIMLVLVGLVLTGVFGFKAFGGYMMKKFMSAAGAPPQTVSSMQAEYQEWQPTLKGVGGLRAVNGADLSPEVAGIVDSIHFESGSEVKEGMVLVRLRTGDDIARLRSLEAAAKLAEITYARDQKQFKIQAISKAQVDTDAANLTSAKAQVVQQQAIVDKKIIRAPFAGQVGIRAVDVGQHVDPGMTVVTLQQLDPIFLDLYLPQQSLPQLQIGQKVTVKTDTYPNQVFEGQLSAINAKVDPNTRNIQLRVTLKNEKRLLLPGMYATAEIATGDPQKLITLPQTAITYNPYGNTVFLVDNASKDAKGKPQIVARQTFVTTGDTRGDQVAVLTGLKEGDQVVTTGQIKLQNGSSIIINNKIQPRFDSDPHPEDR
ncbi:MAG: efflux RND transporter periplasmic adaptor subunit [Proteobacteria bacterium]|nr:efflux RND transporter periplasmic adaptor subunit [Pseudomonadota bacterium]